MGIGERLAKATSADDLGWADNKIKPVDLVAALAATSNLGSDLHRAKDHDQTALRRAVMLLSRKAMKQGERKRLFLSRAMAQAMAITAILERCMPNCRTCHGAKVVIAGDLKIDCHTCNGVGIHRYTDNERAKLCGIKPEDWHQWRARYAMVIDLAIGHDTAQKDAAIRLGKND